MSAQSTSFYFKRGRAKAGLHEAAPPEHASRTLYGGITATHLPEDPEAATATVQTIRDVARDARDDMDRVLGAVGRTPDGPLPSGLAEVPVLTERLRAAGVTVALVVSGEPGLYPADLDHTAYRVVQEGLTNAMKHARDASVTVSIEHQREAVTIEVFNDEQSPPAAPGGQHQGLAARNGRGITGLDHRVRELGGQLNAGTQPQGGFLVSAVLPL